MRPAGTVVLITALLPSASWHGRARGRWHGWMRTAGFEAGHLHLKAGLRATGGFPASAGGFARVWPVAAGPAAASLALVKPELHPVMYTRSGDIRTAAEPLKRPLALARSKQRRAAPPQKPTITPALASSRIAACVTDVPVPSSTVVALAMGIFSKATLCPARSRIRHGHHSPVCGIVRGNKDW